MLYLCRHTLRRTIDFWFGFTYILIEIDQELRIWSFCGGFVFEN